MDDSLIEPQPALIFIGGTGRSGTNILKAILGQHAAVATLPFEYRFIVDPDGLVDFYRSMTASWTPFMADTRLRRLEQFLRTIANQSGWHRLLGSLIRRFDRQGRWLSPHHYHGYQLSKHLPNFEQHCDNLLAELRDFTFPACWVGTPSYQREPRLNHAAYKEELVLALPFRRFVNRLVADFLAQQGRSVFVEDNTWNILCARELFQFVPQAKLLHIYRDPRDVVASFMAQRWSPRDAEQAARWYRDMLAYWWRNVDRLPAGSTLEISLEALTADPETMLRAVCQHVDLPFDPAMLTIDLAHANQGRWRQDLDRHEKDIVNTILKSTIERLGYG